MDRAARFQRAVENGTDRVNAGFVVAGTVGAVEIIGKEEDSAVGDARLVDPGDRADNVDHVSIAVVHLITEIGKRLEAGPSHNARSVPPEAHGVQSRVAAADLAVRENQANRQTVLRVVEIAVDSGDHPIAL